MSTTSPDQGRCPVCGKARVERFRPFCSRRCQQVDLHRWLGGTYRIQMDDPDEEMPEEGPERTQ